MLTNPDKAQIIKNLLKLFDVKPAPEEQTSLFKDLPDKQNELDKAFEYWIDETKEIFGEPGKIEKTHGLKESGIDLLLNLIDSKFKFGFQIKTYNDINISMPVNEDALKILNEVEQSVEEETRQKLPDIPSTINVIKNKNEFETLLEENEVLL